MESTGPFRICVRGLLSDTTFHMARCCAEDLSVKDPDQFQEIDVSGMLEFDWDIYVKEKKKEIRGETWLFEEKAAVFINDEFIGGPLQFLQWAEQEFNYENFRPQPLYETLAEEAYKNHLNSKNYDYIFMEFSIDDKPVGKLVIELYSDQVPITCENFRALCTGEKGESKLTEYKLHYKDSIIHRIVPNGWIQGGDIWMKRGDGGESIYGPVFADENFSIPHNRRGILSMANKGPHTNGSQFFITLQPAQWMDTKYVAFGKVIEGTTTLKAIEEQNTVNERPKNVKVTDSGVRTYDF